MNGYLTTSSSGHAGSAPNTRIRNSDTLLHTSETGLSSWAGVSTCSMQSTQTASSVRAIEETSRTASRRTITVGNTRDAVHIAAGGFCTKGSDPSHKQGETRK